MKKHKVKNNKKANGKCGLCLSLVFSLISLVSCAGMPFPPMFNSSLGGSSSESEQSNSSSSSNYPLLNSSSSSNSSSFSGSSSDEKEEELSIHFLQLGNSDPGDCTLIKTGDTEVLIDAGSSSSSVSTVVSYLEEYCTDGILEYVIATHADYDHIAAFVGTDSTRGVFKSFFCQTIIDFPRTDKDKTKKTYQNYVKLRDNEVKMGAKHYTALECWKEENGAQRSYALTDNIRFEILYQKYYEESSSSENNYSVCTLFTNGDEHYLFTGDLEQPGELSLVENNDLPKCDVFKAGHHGSSTSNTAALMSVVQPSIVVANCVVGGEYNFPHQAFINNVAPYTDKIYAPRVVSGSASTLLNGNVVVTSKNGILSVNCSFENTLLKDTTWFKANRSWPKVV